MDLNTLKKVYADKGCDVIYIKTLSANDNSKNQVYLGGSYDILNILPIKSIESESVGKWKRQRFKSKLNFSWITEKGNICEAPNSQLILYPKYPEVRLSGFLMNCKNAPSNLMTQRLPGRLLFIGASKSGQILAYITAPDSQIANEINSISHFEQNGVFNVIYNIKGIKEQNSRKILLQELKRIHKKGWIDSKKLTKDKLIAPCNSPNCGGYTLEAEFGITPNSYSDPDFLGWEIKQFHVRNFNLLQSSVITLMTPEPTTGLYKTKGVEAFILKYGYKDKTGRKNRMNFGGIHKYNIKHDTTGLVLKIVGYSYEDNKITDSDGYIGLVSEKDSIAAAWSFTSILTHWRKKHNKASYTPSMSRKEPKLQYYFSDKIILGTGTTFDLFLKSIVEGHIYYDPGIKMENISKKPKIKRRSQFRIKSKYITQLYNKTENIHSVTI